MSGNLTQGPAIPLLSWSERRCVSEIDLWAHLCRALWCLCADVWSRKNGGGHPLAQVSSCVGAELPTRSPDPVCPSAVSGSLALHVLPSAQCSTICNHASRVCVPSLAALPLLGRTWPRQLAGARGVLVVVVVCAWREATQCDHHEHVHDLLTSQSQSLFLVVTESVRSPASTRAKFRTCGGWVCL